MTRSRETLIIFTRFPTPGAVKTRLISAVGSERATALHRRLTLRTVRTAQAVAAARDCRLEIHFDGGNEAAMRHWLGDEHRFRSQSGPGLGERMAFAFVEAFGEKSEAVIIVGTDCPDLTADNLHRAFDSLAGSPVVLGPADDGGYYLIGLRQFLPELFIGIPWGSEAVLDETLRILDGAKVKPALLERLPDIDRPEDLPHWQAIRQAEERDLHRLSVIIPALNEAGQITATIEAARNGNPHEIIVVDGGSTDGTPEHAREACATVLMSRPGRSQQMNGGAARATGEVLLFLHADTLLPSGYAAAALTALRQPDIVAGAFRFRVDRDFAGKSLLEWGTNFRSRWLRLPYGDQAIFLRRSLFEELGGFAEMSIMEDYELVWRLRRLGRIAAVPLSATTSGRRWRRLGIFKTTLINALMIAGYHAGVSDLRLAKSYRVLLNRSRAS